MDHLVQIDLYGSSRDPIMEAHTTLSALAPLTQKIKLGALCTCNFFRSPALLAKMGATLDQISKGRFWLGIGAGWYEDEARRYGYEFHDAKTRLDMLEESVKIIDKIWTEEAVSFKGKYYTVNDLTVFPRPIQKPRPKILIGGEGEKITLKLVAKYGDACNFFATGELLEHKLTVLKNHCKAVSRDYTSILKTKLTSVMFANTKEEALKKIEPFKPSWLDIKSYNQNFLYGNPSEISNQVSDLNEMGIDYLIVNFRNPYEPNDTLRFSQDVMSRF